MSLSKTQNTTCQICNNTITTNNQCSNCGWIKSDRQKSNEYLPNQENNLSFFYYKYWFQQTKIINPKFVWSLKKVNPTIEDVLLLYRKDVNHKELINLNICMICESSIIEDEIDICPVCAWTNTVMITGEIDEDETLGPNYLSYENYKLWYSLKKKVNPYYTWDKFKIDKKIKEDLKDLIQQTKHYK